MFSSSSTQANAAAPHEQPAYAAPPPLRSPHAADGSAGPGSHGAGVSLGGYSPSSGGYSHSPAYAVHEPEMPPPDDDYGAPPPYTG